MFYISIPGKPVAKKQLRCRCLGRHGHVYNPSSKDQARIAQLFKDATKGAIPYACPIRWDVKIYVPIPKSTPKLKRFQMMRGLIRPDVRPDDDNYTYLLSNAASGSFYDDDKRRVESHVYKYYEDERGPRVEVLVEPITQGCQ